MDPMKLCLKTFSLQLQSQYVASFIITAKFLLSSVFISCMFRKVTAIDCQLNIFANVYKTTKLVLFYIETFYYVGYVYFEHKFLFRSLTFFMGT